MAFTTHKSILDGINRDDENSWRRVYKFYTPLIRLAGKDFHVPEMYLDDLVQNVFITLASGKTIVFDSSRGRFVYFLRGIVRNKAREMLRRIFRDEKTETYMISQADTIIEPDLFSEEWQQYIRMRILKMLKSELTPELFQIFDFLYIRRWPVTRVSRYLGLPISTVYFARKKIQKKCRIIRFKLNDF